ncbi:hypothetical protein TNCV_543401 [Trichonephila clavipes]|nr:hypothetical protein TNCV_543401 [Trichonephila clavipes]
MPLACLSVPVAFSCRKWLSENEELICILIHSVSRTIASCIITREGFITDSCPSSVFVDCDITSLNPGFAKALQKNTIYIKGHYDS